MDKDMTAREYEKYELELAIRRHLEINLESVRKFAETQYLGLNGMRFKFQMTRRSIDASIPLLLSDMLWTENIPYMRQVLDAFYRAVLLGEEIFDKAFGGPTPEPNQFGFHRYNEGDIKGESYTLQNDEMLLVYGMRPKIEEGATFRNALIECGQSKMIPLEHSSPREDTYLYRVAIIEPRSSIRCTAFKVIKKDGTYWTDGDLSGLIGWWVNTASRALERR